MLNLPRFLISPEPPLSPQISGQLNREGFPSATAVRFPSRNHLSALPAFHLILQKIFFPALFWILINACEINAGMPWKDGP